MNDDLAGGVVRADAGDALGLVVGIGRRALDIRSHERRRAAPRDRQGALDRVGEVACLDRIAVGVLEALAQRDRVGLAAVADDRQARGQARDQLGAADAIGVGVRVEAGVDLPVDLGALGRVVQAGIE